MTDPHESSAPLAMLSVEELARRLANGDLASVEVVDNCLARIASIDVNPFLINAKTGVAVDGLIVLNNAAANSAAKH